MRLLRTVCMLLALVAGSAPLAAAADGPLGPLAGKVLIGRGGDWEGSLTAEAYRLENRQGKDSAVRFFSLEPPFRDRGDAWTASVEVAVLPAGDRGFAGLIYDYRASPRHYLIFALAADGRAVLWRRDEGGLAVIAQSDPRPGRAQGELRLIEITGRTLFLADGELVHELPAAQLVLGETGIVAGGRGAFGFKGFAWDTVTVNAPEPAQDAPAPVAADAPVSTETPTPPPLPTPPAVVSETPPPLPSPPSTPAPAPAAPSLGALGGGGAPPAPSLGALGGTPAN